MWRKIIDDYKLYYLNDLFEIKWIFYGLSCMLQFSEFVWTLGYSVWDVFNNFLLIDARDRSKISSVQKRFFIALSLYPLSFFANTPFKMHSFCGNWVQSLYSLHDNILFRLIKLSGRLPTIMIYLMQKKKLSFIIQNCK